MFGCLPCLGTKSLLNDITNQMKGLSTQGHGHPQPTASQPGSPAAGKAEASERFKKRKKKQPRKQRRRQAPEEGNGDGCGQPDPHEEGEHDPDAEEEEEEEEDEEDEESWVAEVDRGVFITFVYLPGGGNRIKKIHFREDMFDASAAQKWWNDNYENILDLYSVRRTCSTPAQYDDDQGPSSSTSVHDNGSGQTAEPGNSEYKPAASASTCCPAVSVGTLAGGAQGSRTAASGKLVEWVIEDQTGVFVTIRSLSNGTKDIRRVELSREMFGEVRATVWWEENKDRLRQLYT